MKLAITASQFVPAAFVPPPTEVSVNQSACTGADRYPPVRLHQSLAISLGNFADQLLRPATPLPTSACHKGAAALSGAGRSRAQNTHPRELSQAIGGIFRLSDHSTIKNRGIRKDWQTVFRYDHRPMGSILRIRLANSAFIAKLSIMSFDMILVVPVF
jgi:hypothetical protein